MLERRKAIATLMANRPKDLFVVPGLGSTTYDMASLGEKDTDFYLWGAMGGAAMIGLGIAQTYEVDDEAGLNELARELGALRETLFARVRIAADEPTRVLPSKDGVELKLRFRRAVAAAGG